MDSACTIFRFFRYDLSSAGRRSGNLLRELGIPATNARHGWSLLPCLRSFLQVSALLWAVQYSFTGRQPLRKAAEFDPTDAFAHLNLTRAYLTTGDTAAAAQSALDLAGAYRRRSDFDPQLTAAVLEKFAAALEQRGDGASAARLRDAAKRL